MNLKSLKNVVTSKAGRSVLKMQKHSPVILFTAGVVGVVGTVVLACQATLKMDEALDEITKQKTAAKELHDRNMDQYSDEDFKQDMMLLYVRSAVKIVKLYAPAIVVGVASIAALTGAHVVLSRRNIAVTAAYAALEKGYQEYRRRVVDDLGEDKDREYRYGLVDHEVHEKKADGSTEITKIKGLNNKDISIYARFFDETCKDWNRNAGYNSMFIQCQQNYANDLLRARGHVFLNEVYDMLGMPRSKEGAVVGWVVNDRGDNYVDFGVFSGDTFMGQEFVNGNEMAVLLDFNVDGIIYDKI
jgi:hypothetical protein